MPEILILILISMSLWQWLAENDVTVLLNNAKFLCVYIVKMSVICFLYMLDFGFALSYMMENKNINQSITLNEIDLYIKSSWLTGMAKLIKGKD